VGAYRAVLLDGVEGPARARKPHAPPRRRRGLRQRAQRRLHPAVSCPVSTGGGTGLVRLVRGEGRGLSG
jgi:hypothetical protein